MTRARRSMVIVTSFKPSDLDDGRMQYWGNWDSRMATDIPNEDRAEAAFLLAQLLRERGLAADKARARLLGETARDAYAARGRDGVRSAYALDLGAAAGGCLIAPRLVGPLAPTEIVAALGVLGGAWALVVVERRPRLLAGGRTYMNTPDSVGPSA